MMDVRWRWRWRYERRGDGEETALNTHQRLSGESDVNWQTGGPEFGGYSKVLNECKVFFLFFKSLVEQHNWNSSEGKQFEAARLFRLGRPDE